MPPTLHGESPELRSFAQNADALALDDRPRRFSRMNPKPGTAPSSALLSALADAMCPSASTNIRDNGPDSDIPAGFTYLGQFVDHDLTLDASGAELRPGETLDPTELVQGRTPSLDLDCLYGAGPYRDARFYSDGMRLRVGSTRGTGLPASDRVAHQSLYGFDLPRDAGNADPALRRRALIPDQRNDENLAVAQVHVAFIRFHNRVVDKVITTGERPIFESARREVVLHYQWMLRHDFLPRIVQPEVLNEVFAKGRRFFEAPTGNKVIETLGTMPIEFSVAAYRIGHSMVRASYEWNRVFETNSVTPASLQLLFNFSGTSGTLQAPNESKPESGRLRLPTNWIVDWRRLFDFTPINASLAAPKGKANFARPLDTHLTNPLAKLPEGSFGRISGPASPAQQMNLAFRNLTRGAMVQLPNGLEMAEFLQVSPLTNEQIINGNGTGVDLSTLDDALKTELTTNPPLWFYVLREAEFSGNGRLGAVGSRIVAETFHRAMESSRHSIVREKRWRPTLGRAPGAFEMIDLVYFAFDGELNPLDDRA